MPKLYSDDAHFIFELLQNAEDALTESSSGSGEVKFHLTQSDLRFHHFGKPFDEDDVRGICDFGGSTKKKNFSTIGKFGIGFKAVYNYTSRPEIYSGEERFAIEKGVYPYIVPPIHTEPGETIVVMPTVPGAFEKVADGLKDLKITTLLFLREIKKIRWVIENDQKGFFKREEKDLSDWVRRVKVSSQKGDVNTSEEWLVFSKPVEAKRRIEIAFSLEKDEKDGKHHINALNRSDFVVFFPTEQNSHLGFLIQGPYNTTPSRDNLRMKDEWNHKLAVLTANLLVKSLEWLKSEEWLDVGVLEALPLKAEDFEGQLLEPLFNSTKKALTGRPLLPSYDGGFVSAKNAVLGRTQKLREMFSAEQLSQIYGGKQKLAWISGDITRERSHDLREYLKKQLDVKEADVEKVASLLNENFLSMQPDEWIKSLYAFFGEHPRLVATLKNVPLIRLECGKHVKAREEVFLPGDGPAGFDFGDFDMVRRSVCGSEDSEPMKFLRSLGLEGADLVDYVIKKILPKYQQSEVSVDDDEYNKDIDVILLAYGTDNFSQKLKLDSNLENSAFVPSVDAGSGEEIWCFPHQVYYPTKRLKALFDGIEDMLFVNDRYDCLKGNKIRALLDTCGVSMNLYCEDKDSYPNYTELQELMTRAGKGAVPGWQKFRMTDYVIDGLEALLNQLPDLDAERRREKAECLWMELIQLENQTKSVFSMDFYGRRRSNAQWNSFDKNVDSKFVQILKQERWITDENGDLRRPSAVVFESLGWKENPFLQKTISFVFSAIEQACQEKGLNEEAQAYVSWFVNASDAERNEAIEAKNRASSEADDQDEEDDTSESGEWESGSFGGKSDEEEEEEVTEEEEEEGESPAATSSGRVAPGETAAEVRAEETSGSGTTTAQSQPAPPENRTTSSGSGGSTSLALRVEVRSSGRMGPAEPKEVERRAIDFVIKKHPKWKRTKTNNPGFDLYQDDEQGNITQWCEVKSTGEYWKQRGAVRMSIPQFNLAQEKGDKFWLYVVERAGHEDARIIRIRNPAKYIDALAFDHGWASVAEAEPDEDEN